MRSLLKTRDKNQEDSWWVKRAAEHNPIKDSTEYIICLMENQVAWLEVCLERGWYPSGMLVESELALDFNKEFLQGMRDWLEVWGCCSEVNI